MHNNTSAKQLELGNMAAITLVLGLLIVPSVLLAQKAAPALLERSNSLAADVALELDLTGQKATQRIALAADLDRRDFDRVDVYSGPCGDGYQVIVADADMEISTGYGCEAMERTYIRKLPALSVASSTDEILSR